MSGISGPTRGGRILRSNPWARLATALFLTIFAVAALLAGMADLAAARAAEGVVGRFDADETVVVWSHGLESADAAAARASEILARVPGVSQARWLDPAAGDRLAAVALGAPGEQGRDVRLISVTAPGGGKALARRMVEALAAQDLPARATSRSGIASAGYAAPILAAAVLVPLLAILAFAIVCWVEARREMRRSHAVVDLMRISGASPGFIAREVRRRISGLALVASLWGASGAMVVAALAVRRNLAGPLGGLSRHDLLTPWAALVLVLWLAALAGAGLGARSRLKRMG
jgi:cell division protein FtsX